jgi:hypothetical protein
LGPFLNLKRKTTETITVKKVSVEKMDFNVKWQLIGVNDQFLVIFPLKSVVFIQ